MDFDGMEKFFFNAQNGTQRGARIKIEAQYEIQSYVGIRNHRVFMFSILISTFKTTNFDMFNFK